MDELKSWKIDLKTVYGSKWDNNRQPRPGVDYSLWESPDGKIACLLYNIKEIGISKEIGSLAIFRNKEMPDLIFNFRYLEVWYLYESAVQFGKNGILFIHRFSQKHLTLCVLNLKEQQFAIMDQIAGNFYDVRHIDGLRYSLKNSSSDEKIIELRELKWKPLQNWSDFYSDVPIADRALRSAFILMAKPFYLLISFLRKIFIMKQIKINFEHPSNIKLFQYLEGREAGKNLPASTSAKNVRFPYLNLGTHPDLVARLWDEITIELPVDCRWVVHATPVLVHPKTGIVFAFAEGTHTYAMRLPEKERNEALRSGAKLEHQYPGQKPLVLKDIGKEWILGGWIKGEEGWCSAAYKFAGDNV